MLFWISFFFVLVIYSIIILSAVFGWLLLDNSVGPGNEIPNTFISIVIPFRNEGANLENLLNNLGQINYKQENYEVIFVNDHSKDQGCDIIRAFSKRNENIRVFHLNHIQSGKKAALNLGINNARGEICLLTDADCIFHPEWLNSYNRCYIKNQRPSMIIGLVDYLPGNSIIHKLFRLEFLSLILTGAGLAAIKKPVFCNGANLAIKRSDYTGPDSLRQEIASGDDVFLLHEFERLKKPVKVLKSKEGIVYTLPPKTMKEFLRQRIRWGSKAKNYTNTNSVILSFLVLFTSVFLISGTIYGAVSGELKLLLYGLAVKMGSDVLLFLSGTVLFNYSKFLSLIIPMEIIYPFYILVTALAGIKGPFEWKGRR